MSPFETMLNTFFTTMATKKMQKICKNSLDFVTELTVFLLKLCLFTGLEMIFASLTTRL